MLFANMAQLREGSRLGFLCSEKSIRAAQVWFAIWLIPIGLSHIFYVKATVDLVPAWLPYRTGWAYLTGIGHIAAGLGVLFSVFPALAAMMEAAMVGVFTLLVWAPAIVKEPRARLPWTAFFISWAIAAGAWVVAQSIASRQGKTEDQKAATAA